MLMSETYCVTVRHGAPDEEKATGLDKPAMDAWVRANANSGDKCDFFPEGPNGEAIDETMSFVYEG